MTSGRPLSRPVEQPGTLVGTVRRLTLVNGLVTAIGLVTGPLLARALGPGGRGDLAAIMVPLTFLAHSGDFGLATYATIEAARGRPVARLLGTLGPALVIVGVVAAIALVPLVGLLAGGRTIVRAWLLVGLLLLPATLLIALFNGLARGLERWNLWIGARLVTAVGPLLGLVVLFFTNRLTLTAAAALLLAFSILAAVPLLQVIQRVGRPIYDPGLLRQAVPFSLRAWLTNLTSLGNQRVDQLFMVVLVSSRELGLYVAAVTVATSARIFYDTVGMFVLSLVARGDTQLVPRALRTSLAIVTILSLLVGVLAWPLVMVVLGRDFAGSVSIIWVLLMASLPLAGTNILSQALLGAGRPSAAGWAQIVALFITIPGLLITLPSFGSIGAASVSLVAYSVSFCYLLGQARRLCSVSILSLLVPRLEDLHWARRQFAPLWRTLRNAMRSTWARRTADR